MTTTPSLTTVTNEELDRQIENFLNDTYLWGSNASGMCDPLMEFFEDEDEVALVAGLTGPDLTLALAEHLTFGLNDTITAVTRTLSNGESVYAVQVIPNYDYLPLEHRPTGPDVHYFLITPETTIDHLVGEYTFDGRMQDEVYEDFYKKYTADHSGLKAISRILTPLEWKTFAPK